MFLITMGDGNGLVEVELIVSHILEYLILDFKVLNLIKIVNIFGSGFQKLELYLRRMFMIGILNILSIKLKITYQLSNMILLNNMFLK